MELTTIDVGKMEQPEYFTENSQSGHNPHDDIWPELSALIIKWHVQSSLEKARQFRLPKQVVDIIGEHGNSVVLSSIIRRCKMLQKFIQGILPLFGSKILRILVWPSSYNERKFCCNDCRQG